MDELELAEQFDRQWPQLRAIAYRILASFNGADDAVREAWLRLGANRRRADRQPEAVADDGCRADLLEHALVA